MAVSEAIVIGAGIVGAACAAELAHAGLRVTLLDQAQPGTDSTAARKPVQTRSAESAPMFGA